MKGIKLVDKVVTHVENVSLEAIKELMVSKDLKELQDKLKTQDTTPIELSAGCKRSFAMQSKATPFIKNDDSVAVGLRFVQGKNDFCVTYSLRSALYYWSE